MRLAKKSSVPVAIDMRNLAYFNGRYLLNFSMVHMSQHTKQGWHRLEKYLNIQDCHEKSLKIKFALKST